MISSAFAHVSVDLCVCGSDSVRPFPHDQRDSLQTQHAASRTKPPLLPEADRRAQKEALDGDRMETGVRGGTCL